MPETIPNQTIQDIPPLVCPNCGTPLIQDAAVNDCAACDRSWSVGSGIYNFQDSGAQMSGHSSEINRLAEHEGWLTAAETVASKSSNPAHHLEYITSEARADFRFLLPATRDDIVLDVCGGWGNLTAAFARTSKHVFALDTSWDKLEFSKIRSSQEGLDNVTFIHSNPNEIPLPSASCHIAILADTLECDFWRKNSVRSKSDHSALLQAIWEKLVPGGCLYLGIENRLSYKYILGGRVPSSNLRFISLLPYSVANRYSRLIRNADYQEIVYTLSGIKKSLRQVGFSKFDILYPIPAYPKFRFLADFKSPQATDFMISRLRIHSGFNKSFYAFAKLASFLGVLQWFAPGFSIIAYKE